MKATGIVRRIDELGRVVIPKEIRRTMHLREGEELEIFTGNEEDLIFRKFSPVKRIKEFADEYSTALSETTGNILLVTDKDAIIASAGDKKNTYSDKPLLGKFERLLSLRKTLSYMGVDTVSVTGEPTDAYKGQIVAPILSGGDVLGAIVMISTKNRFEESDRKLVDTAALFLSYQA
ncbi:MAG: AbrB/MazE/SpoVT family DNA-binding domain-containing protein [Clostridiales bacterium]|jgi:AbrB family transcriptional regulator (stage V sporulation protein T)|nr:AbrB/MazE/SpoVT family DNA-binding domain-containing protein [Clostridiales bacterium]